MLCVCACSGWHSRALPCHVHAREACAFDPQLARDSAKECRSRDGGRDFLPLSHNRAKTVARVIRLTRPRSTECNMDEPPRWQSSLPRRSSSRGAIYANQVGHECPHASFDALAPRQESRCLYECIWLHSLMWTTECEISSTLAKGCWECPATPRYFAIRGGVAGSPLLHSVFPRKRVGQGAKRGATIVMT